MKQLQTISVVSPGFYGLNTQESGVTLSTNYAQLVDNCIIDKYGRLGARKGWQMLTNGGTDPIAFMMEHVNADGSVVVLSGGGETLFKDGVESDALVDITPALYTITENNWKGASLYDHALLVQKDHEPVVYSESASPVTQTITDYTSVTQAYGTSYPHDVIAAYGRFWVHDGANVYWTTDIADTTFPAFNGGTSGTLNISAVLPNNTDTIIALGAHNGFLIIFCEHNTVIYRGAENPLGDFALSDVIAGVGCVSRDSVQHTGNDLIFLSDTGVRSLGRVIQEKSLPMRDLTKNVRDDLIKEIQAERSNSASLDLSEVRAVYSEINAFYLLSFPNTNTIYCLDMRQALEDGSSRVTLWYNYPAYSFLRRRNRDLLIGKATGIGRYRGYQDNGESYRLRYFSHYMDMQTPTVTKIVKQIKATIIGGVGQDFVIKSGFDYSTAYDSFAFELGGSVPSEYGIAEYESGEYTVGVSLDTVKGSLMGSGNVIQIGFEADVNGSELSVQKLDVFVKTGRTI
jgi:hypothetical protein